MSGITTASAIGIGLAAVGTATTVYGQISAGNAAASNSAFQGQVARNQAQVMENNAIVAEQNADYVGKVGMENASRESMKGAARQAKIKAGIAANGVDPNSGSAVDVEQSQRELSKLDATSVLSDAELKAYGYRSEATNDRYAAATLRAGGENIAAGGQSALSGSYLKAGGTLLSSLSSLPTKFSFGGGSGADPTGSIRTAGDVDLAGGGGAFSPSGS